MNFSVRRAAGRIAYAIVLWVIAFSTLEQFIELNRVTIALRSLPFHLAAGGLALAAAVFEAVTLRGVHGLQSLLDRPDPLAGVAHRRCGFRAALTRDLPLVRELALKRYGWAFPLEDLERWHRSNPNCLFLMLSDGQLVGYIDAFPISAPDYEHLLAGKDEKLITPLRPDAISPEASFYIASVVILEEWSANLAALLKRAVTFYGRAYPNKSWSRVCAVGYSLGGLTLIEQRQMQPVPRAAADVRMYSIDRDFVQGIGKQNRHLWQKLLPDPGSQSDPRGGA